MLREFLDRLLELKRPETIVSADGVEFFTQTRLPVPRPWPEVLTFQTLTGLVSYIEDSGEWAAKPPLFLTVSDPHIVSLYVAASPDEIHRRLVAQARYAEGLIPFKTWVPLDEFIIMLQARFVETQYRNELLSVLGNVTGEAVHTEADDGVTQRVSMRVGVRLADSTTIKNPVYLTPRRTFPDVLQPESPFILRIRGTDKKEAALYEADGGQWQLEAEGLIVSKLNDLLRESGLTIPTF